MSVKKVIHGHVFIDMKTRITSYGPHNGIIVHCGIQQEPSTFWPYVLSNASNSLCTQQLNIAPTSATIHWPTVKESDDNQQDKATSSLSNQHYQLTDKDRISANNFNDSKKVRLNVFETKQTVFETNPMKIKLKSLNMTSNNCKSNLNNASAKISNGNISSTKDAPLTNAQNVNCHHNEERAMKKNDLNENIRPESMIYSERNGQNTSSIIPMEYSTKRKFINCKYYNEFNDEIMNEMEVEISEQPLLNISKKHLSTNYDQYNRNLNDDIGLSLISDNFKSKSKLKLKDGHYTESQPEYLQPSSNNIFNDTELLRHHCDSLSVRSEIPTQLKVQESTVRTELNENKISVNEGKNISEKTASKLSEVLSTMNCQRLEMTAKERSRDNNRELMIEEGKNFENIFGKLKADNNGGVNNAGITSIKPILHTSSRKSSIRKKVQFPVEWPQVIALEHRLLIDDLHLV
ncbi:Uncharacterized protein BM_BM7823 [Brugia malayi]|nr:Uncharacterized protein BM_BM7823 [Brugia malayi]CDQ04141.1 Bm7823, isoform c [Brugia malayi]VIO95616.1 Uncharacterized protein BM_BM7823 [Brugia malayi]